MMADDNSTYELVAEAIREELAPAKVAVSVKKAVSDKGELFLDIFVRIESEKAPDRQKMFGLLGRIRSMLDSDTAGFPLVSFVTKREASKLSLEFA